MGQPQPDRARLEERYQQLQEEVKRRGGYSGEGHKDMLPLEVKVQFLEEVIRVDDEINGRPRR